MAVQRELPFCLSESGPDEVSGTGNYVLHLYNASGNKVEAALYFLDSHQYASPEIGGYDWIKRDQIEWYTKQSEDLAFRNGSPLPALAFFHIPLPEYQEVWEQQICYGVKEESVGCPKINSGLFAAFVEKNDVMGTFVGHDHVNDYWGELQGIRLCYGRATGYNTYPDDVPFSRGARIIRLKQRERQFDTWLRLSDGTVCQDQPRHMPD